jgi:hypothetical protein
MPCADVKPASFWTASPTNHWRNNRAAGSTHFGFWFELPGHPLGPSATDSRCPDTAPLGSFFNNSAHSNSIGVRIYPHFAPLRVECDYSSGSAPQRFYNTTTFSNAQGFFHRVVGDVHHYNSKWVDNGDGFGWRQFEGSVSMTWDANVVNGLFVCNTAGTGCGSRAITMPQNEFWYMNGVTFVNYANSGAIAGCHSCGEGAHYKQGGYTYRMGGLRFVNSNVRTYWNPPYKCIYWDVDSTLTGFVNGSATYYYGFNNWPECPRDTVGTYQYGTVCNGSAMLRRVQMDYISPDELNWVTLNITSAAGTGLMPFRPIEIYGWVTPMVNTHTGYRHKWQGSLIDWRRFRVRYSEPEYVNAGEFMGLTFTWIDTRYTNLVRYGDYQTLRPSLPAGGAQPTELSDFGTGNMPDRVNKTWNVMITTNNVTDGSYWGKYMFTAWNQQCAPDECLPPPPVNLGNATLWSNIASWGGGRLPIAGEDVIINASQYIIMDVNPPKLGKVTVLGRLEFRDNAPRKLEADAIVVWGELVVGTPDAPFQNGAEIVLYGIRTSTTVLVDNNLFLGNKVLVVLGKVTMHGAVRRTIWARLATTAFPGDTSITLTTSVSGAWFAGDRIVLTATDYNSTKFEEAVVTSVSGTIVNLASPLTYRHFSGAAGATGAAASTYLRAAVGLLTRNVVFRGNLTSLDDTYGAHVVVSSVKNTPIGSITPVVRAGSVDLRHVELRNTGQMLTEHAGILFQYGNFLFDTSIPATNPYNYLEAVAFSESFNYGIVATAAKHLVVNNSVFHRNFRNSISGDADSLNISVVNSLFVGNLRSPDVNAADQTPWYRQQGAIFLQAVPGRLSNNLVSGAIDTGYTYRVPACSSDHARLFSGNEAHGVRIGVWLLSTYATGSCVQLNGFTVWKAAHIGIFTVDQVSDVRITNSLVSDNHIGVSLNFDKSGGDESYSRIQDSVIYGTTLATQGCGDSTACRAVGEDDVKGDGCNSVLGLNYRRAGVLMPQYLNHGKTCERDEDHQMPVCSPGNTIVRMCSMPLERRYGTISAVNVAAYLSNVRFGFFNKTDCGVRSTAIVHNPTQIDQSVPHYISGAVWENVPHDSKFDFRTGALTDEKCQDGVGCDSMNNIYLRDEDGSVTGHAGGSIIGPNPALVYPEPGCLARADWNGFECNSPNVPALRYGHYEGVNQGRVNMGGVQFTRRVDPNDNSTWRTSASFGSIMDLCAERGPQPFRPHIVALATTTAIYQASTEPDTIRYRFFSRDTNEAAIITFAISRPYTRELWYNGAAVAMIDAPTNAVVLPTLSDPAGTWIFSPQARRAWFTARGHSQGAAALYDLVVKPTVQLNLHLAVSVEDFFGADLITNLALLLQIDPWRIKIVDVRPGSAQVSVEIYDNSSTVQAATTADDESGPANEQAQEQLQRLEDISTKLQNLAQSGQLASIGSYTVLSLTVELPVSRNTESATGPITLIPSGRSSESSLSNGVIAAIAVSCAVGAVVVVFAAVAICRRPGKQILSATITQPVAPARAPAASGLSTWQVLSFARAAAGAGNNPALSQRFTFAPVNVALTENHKAGHHV